MRKKSYRYDKSLQFRPPKKAKAIVKKSTIAFAINTKKRATDMQLTSL